MTTTPRLNRTQEPSILLVAKRMSGKSHTRMLWSNHVPMFPIVDDVVGERRIETGTGTLATGEIAEYRCQIEDRAVRVIDTPGEIVDVRSAQAGRYRENLERIAGHVGGVVICVPPPGLPADEQQSGTRRAGYVDPPHWASYCRELVGAGTAPHLDEVRARIDSAIALCEQSLALLGIDPRGLPFVVQIGFTDVIAFGDDEEQHQAAKSWFRGCYRKVWPAPGTWARADAVEARERLYAEIDSRTSSIFADVAAWTRMSYPEYRFWFFASSNKDDSIGHRSPAIGLLYLVDQTLGGEVLRGAAQRRADEAQRAAQATRVTAARSQKLARNLTLAALAVFLLAAVLAVRLLGSKSDDSGELQGTATAATSAPLPPPSVPRPIVPVPPRPARVQPPPPGSGAAAVVASRFPGAEIRTAPSLNAPRPDWGHYGVHGLAPGTQLTVLDRSLDRYWLRVSLTIDGDTIEGWMHRNVVTFLPELAAADVNFNDLQDGQGWSDRCYLHWKALRLGAAKAACNKGLLANPSQRWRGALNFNLGLIAEAEGDVCEAWSEFAKAQEAIPSDSRVQEAIDRCRTSTLGPKCPQAAPDL